MADTLRVVVSATTSVHAVSDTPDQQPTTETAVAATASVDLDAVERDLEGVETALRRLDEGTYWTDEVSGDEIPDEVLANDPVARRTT